VIAKLDDCDDHESRHGRSEQKIHRSSFPRKVGTPLKLVLLNYSWNQADTPCWSLSMSWWPVLLQVRGQSWNRRKCPYLWQFLWS